MRCDKVIDKVKTVVVFYSSRGIRTASHPAARLVPETRKCDRMTPVFASFAPAGRSRSRHHLDGAAAAGVQVDARSVAVAYHPP